MHTCVRQAALDEGEDGQEGYGNGDGEVTKCDWNTVRREHFGEDKGEDQTARCRAGEDDAVGVVCCEGGIGEAGEFALSGGCWLEEQTGIGDEREAAHSRSRCSQVP